MKHLFALSTLFFGFISVSFSQYNNQDEKALYNIVQTMEQGWNEKNGKLFASPFAPDHDYVVVSGIYFPNNTVENNAMSHQRIFDTFYKNRDVELKLDKIRFVRDDLALVHMLGAQYDHNTPLPKDPKVLVTMLIEKQKEGWKIISFHNSPIEVSFEEGAKDSPVPPQVMFQSWYKS